MKIVNNIRTRTGTRSGGTGETPARDASEASGDGQNRDGDPTRNALEGPVADLEEEEDRLGRRTAPGRRSERANEQKKEKKGPPCMSNCC